jgi:hypothetical protein
MPRDVGIVSGADPVLVGTSPLVDKLHSAPVDGQPALTS